MKDILAQNAAGKNGQSIWDQPPRKFAPPRPWPRKEIELRNDRSVGEIFAGWNLDDLAAIQKRLKLILIQFGGNEYGATPANIVAQRILKNSWPDKPPTWNELVRFIKSFDPITFPWEKVFTRQSDIKKYVLKKLAATNRDRKAI